MLQCRCKDIPLHNGRIHSGGKLPRREMPHPQQRNTRATAEKRWARAEETARHRNAKATTEKSQATTEKLWATAGKTGATRARRGAPSTWPK
jgi:hypothetical protein